MERIEKSRIAIKGDTATVETFNVPVEEDVPFKVESEEVTKVRKVDLDDETVNGPHRCANCEKNVAEAIKPIFLTRYTAVFLCPECIQKFINGKLVIWD